MYSLGFRCIYYISRCLWFERNKRMSHGTYYLFTNNSMCLSFAGNSLSFVHNSLDSLSLKLYVCWRSFFVCSRNTLCSSSIQKQFYMNVMRIISCEGPKRGRHRDAHSNTHWQRRKERTTVLGFVFLWWKFCCCIYIYLDFFPSTLCVYTIWMKTFEFLIDHDLCHVHSIQLAFLLLLGALDMSLSGWHLFKHFTPTSNCILWVSEWHAIAISTWLFAYLIFTAVTSLSFAISVLSSNWTSKWPTFDHHLETRSKFSLHFELSSARAHAAVVSNKKNLPVAIIQQALENSAKYSTFAHNNNGSKQKLFVRQSNWRSLLFAS